MIHCTLCQHDKARSEFADSQVHAGTSGQCKSCMVLYREAIGEGVANPAQHVRNALPPVECSVCGKTKPTREFTPRAPVATCVECWEGDRKARQAESMRKLRAATPAEEKARAQAAFRAGMRKDKCAICGHPIEGHGICDSCDDAVHVLGGLDGLKQAVRAVRYLEGQ